MTDFLTPEERARLDEGVVWICPPVSDNRGACFQSPLGQTRPAPYLPQETAHYFARLLEDARRESWERDTA